MADDFSPLAERCEQATGPDWQLDLDISEATGVWRTLPSFREWHPTASLDAAMSLVPEGASIDVRTGQTFSGAVAMVHPPAARPTVTVRAATPALALCAAALKARAMKENGDG